MPTVDEIRDEERRARYVRMIVDFTCAVISQGSMERAEAQALVDAARDRILELFPGREDTYELLYAPRFRRIVEEFARRSEPVRDRRGIVLPFPGARNR